MSSNIKLKNNLDTELVIAHRDGSGAKTLYTDEMSVSVATVALMEAIATPDDGATCIVKDMDRGGIFVYDSSLVLSDNQGTNFSGWIRQYSGSINVKWFNVKGDGTIDDTTALQAASDFCSNNDLTLSATDIEIGISLPLYFACDIVMKNSRILVLDTFVGATAVILEWGGSKYHGVNINGGAVGVSGGITGINIGNPPTPRFSLGNSGIPYEITTSNMKVSNFSIGIELSTYQNHFDNLIIATCTTGLSMYGIGNNREINLNTFVGGGIRGCSDWCVYIGDTRNTDCRVDGEQQGHNNAFYNTQILGSISVGYTSGLLFSAVDFEKNIYGDGIACTVHAKTLGLKLDDCFFNGYNYGVKYTGDADVSNTITMSSPSYNAVSICGLYTISELTSVEYYDSSAINSFTSGAELHFGIRVTATAIPTSNLKRVSSDIYNIPSPKITDEYIIYDSFLKNSRIEYKYTYHTGIQKRIPVSIAGTLTSYKVTATTLSDCYGLIPSTKVVGTQNGYISNVDYENGIISIIGYFSASPIAVTVTSYEANMVTVDYSGAAPTTGTWTAGSIVYDTTPSASGTLGWVCVVSGTSGTWKTFGTIGA